MIKRPDQILSYVIGVTLVTAVDDGANTRPSIAAAARFFWAREIPPDTTNTIVYFGESFAALDRGRTAK
jgi:hypothetical protein